MFQNPDDLAFFQKLDVLSDHTKTTVVNGSGVDLEHFAVAPLPEKPVFLCLSRLLKSKGVAEYAQAALQLKERYSDVSFRLIGPREDGADTISPEAVNEWRSRGLEIGPAVEDVRPEMAQASVYVLPSYREARRVQSLRP